MQTDANVHILCTGECYCSQQASYWCVHLACLWKVWKLNLLSELFHYISQYSLTTCYWDEERSLMSCILQYHYYQTKDEDVIQLGLTHKWWILLSLLLGCMTATFLWFLYYTCRNIIFSLKKKTLQSEWLCSLLRRSTQGEQMFLPLIVDLTVISHLHQRQRRWILCWNPSLVFQCALIADWPDWDCRHQSYFLLPVTSCPVYSLLYPLLSLKI